jgi:DNA polymerase-3 subunit beta
MSLEVVVDQSNLSHAMRLVSRAVPTRSTLPLLQTVRLDAQSDRLSLTTTDLEVGMTTSVAANVSVSGSVCVPARLLSDYVAQLPSETVRLSMNPEGHRLRLGCGRFVANLATFEAAEFPALPDGEEDRGLTLDAALLRQAIVRVAFAAARDEVRPVLTAVLFDFGREGLTLAAADGFRLARARLSSVSAPAQQLLVPSRAVTELGRLLGNSESVRLLPTAQDRGIHAVVGETTLFTRLIEGRFPDVERVIPPDGKTHVIVEAAGFHQAIRVVGLFGSSNDARPVVLEAEVGRLHLRARGDESGDAEVDLPAELAGEPQAIALNTRLLIDVLEAVEAARLRLSWSSHQTPIVLREVGRAEAADLAIIMPLSNPALARSQAAA